MKTYIESAIAHDAVRFILLNADAPAHNSISVYFKGYTAEDLECKYCAHYGGKSKGCLIAECCCSEEKRQAALMAANNKEE